MKTSSKIKIGVVTAVTAMATLTSSCKKQSNETPTSYQSQNNGNAVIKLTATAPPNADFSMVNVEIKKIEVQYQDGNWTELKSPSKIYNVLKLKDDLSAILSTNDQMNSGTLSKIRLTMGYHNSVILNDASGEHVYPLRLAERNSIVAMDLVAKIDKDRRSVITLSFNTSASVEVEEQGTYIFKPTLEIKSVATE